MWWSDQETGALCIWAPESGAICLIKHGKTAFWLLKPMQKGYPKPALSAVRQLRQQTAKQMNIPVRTGTEEAEAWTVPETWAINVFFSLENKWYDHCFIEREHNSASATGRCWQVEYRLSCLPYIRKSRPRISARSSGTAETADKSIRSYVKKESMKSKG